MDTSSSRSRGIGCLTGLVAGGIIAGIAAITAAGQPAPTPYQQCVASIRAENTATQVLGYTPQCMQLSTAQRQAAIKDAVADGG